MDRHCRALPESPAVPPERARQPAWPLRQLCPRLASRARDYPIRTDRRNRRSFSRSVPSRRGPARARLERPVFLWRARTGPRRPALQAPLASPSPEQMDHPKPAPRGSRALPEQRQAARTGLHQPVSPAWLERPAFLSSEQRDLPTPEPRAGLRQEPAQPERAQSVQQAPARVRARAPLGDPARPGPLAQSAQQERPDVRERRAERESRGHPAAPARLAQRGGDAARSVRLAALELAAPRELRALPVNQSRCVHRSNPSRRNRPARRTFPDRR